MRSDAALRRQTVDVFADYHQFYVQDGGVRPLVPEEWTDLDVERRAKVAENLVIVCPVRNMTVPVEVAVFEAQPPADAAWDHVVECSLSLPTGHLQVHECTGGAVLDWHIQPGIYAVRLLFAGLGTLSENGLEGNDKYQVQLWLGESRSLSVARAWVDNNEA